MFVLDTNVVSELRKAKSAKANPQVLAWASRQAVSSFYLSVVTLLELETGILQAERRDAAQGSILRHWLESQVLPAFDGRILPVDVTVARICAGLHVPDPRSDRDALIAATAKAHDMVVATRNICDFQPTGVKLVDPWAFELGA